MDIYVSLSQMDYGIDYDLCKYPQGRGKSEGECPELKVLGGQTEPQEATVTWNNGGMPL